MHIIRKFFKKDNDWYQIIDNNVNVYSAQRITNQYYGRSNPVRTYPIDKVGEIKEIKYESTLTTKAIIDILNGN